MSDRSTAPGPAPRSGPVRSALIGAVFGVDVIGHCLALATICFAGALSAGLGLATGLFVLTTLFASLVLARFGRFPTPLAVSQDTTISILAPAVVLSASLATGPQGANLATAFAVIGLSATASGIGFWLIGQLGLGRLVRMFPFSVAAGFLAASGYLLVFAALSILTHHGGFAAIAAAAADPAVQLRLLPALAMAVALFLAMRLVGGTLPVLVVVFLFLIGHYAVCAVLGITQAEAVALGLLPPPPSWTVGGGTDFGLQTLALIDWSAVLVAVPTIAAVVLLNTIGLLLNITGVEIATRSDVQENRELRVAGLTNLAIGAFGGLTAFLQGGASIVAAKLGAARGPLLLGYVAILAPGAFFAPAIVASVPTFIPAALLMFIGVTMLSDWLIDTRRRLTAIDWSIVAAIVLATALVGILWAIAIGLALAVLGFALASIRVPILRRDTSAAIRRSICDRNALEDVTLAREGHRIRLLHLQGPLFFGSVEQLTRHLRRIIADDPEVSHVILDFTEVQSFDSSACAALDKLANLAASRGIAVHLTGVSPGLRSVFDRWGLPLTEGATGALVQGFRIWPDLDQALDHGETEILERFGPRTGAGDFAEVLRHLSHDHPRLPDLIGCMERQDLAAGDVLIRAFEPSRDVFFVVSGRLGVHLPAERPAGPSMRVRAIGAGAIVGEIATLTGAPRNADVICEQAAQVLRLPEAAIRRIEAEDHDLAALLMAVLGRSLATKLAQTNRLLTYSAGGSGRQPGPAPLAAGTAAAEDRRRPGSRAGGRASFRQP